MNKYSLIKGLFASLLLAAPTAQAITLDFEGFANGTVMTNQYAGVTISAINNYVNPDHAVIFDSTPDDDDIRALNTASDPDLMADFNHLTDSTKNGYDPGNILIIQDNLSGCPNSDSTQCTRPDDQAGSFANPAGLIRFEFDDIVSILSLDYFDVEHNENNGQTGSEIRFYDAGGAELFFADTYHSPNTGGDNKWDQVLFEGVVGIRRIDVHLIGSGAIDNLVYSVVPVPAAIWLFGTALVGFIGFSRRTSI